MANGTTDGTRLAAAGKRATDVLIAVPMLLVALPVVVVSLVGSALSLRTSPLFAQRRVGRGGEQFTLLKVRTLPTHTPKYAAKHDIADVATPTFTRWLRKMHLDELPQLLHVLTGRMALVGPRPEMQVLHDQVPAEFAAMRTSVRPGCTGLWQISPQSGGLIHESPVYDEFYVRNRSMRLDLWVLYKTLAVTVFGRPTVRLTDIPTWVLRHEPELDLEHSDYRVATSVD